MKPVSAKIVITLITLSCVNTQAQDSDESMTEAPELSQAADILVHNSFFANEENLKSLVNALRQEAGFKPPISVTIIDAADISDPTALEVLAPEISDNPDSIPGLSINSKWLELNNDQKNTICLLAHGVAHLAWGHTRELLRLLTQKFALQQESRRAENRSPTMTELQEFINDHQNDLEEMSTKWEADANDIAQALAQGLGVEPQICAVTLDRSPSAPPLTDLGLGTSEHLLAAFQRHLNTLDQLTEN